MESSKGTQSTPPDEERSLMREGTNNTGPARSMDYTTPQSNRFGINFETYNNQSGESYTRRHKRMKLSHEGNIDQEKAIANSVDYSDPFAISNLKKELEHGIYGYATKYMEDLRAQKFLMLKRLLAQYPSLSGTYLGSAIQSADSDDDCVLVDIPSSETLKSQGRSAEGMKELGGANDKSIIILDSDEENFEDKPEVQLECTPCYQSRNNMMNDYLEANRKASHGYREAPVKSPAGVNLVGDVVVGNCSKDIVAREETMTEVATKENGIKVVCEEENRSLGGEPSGKTNGEYVGVQDDSTNTGSPQSTDDDEFGDEWREMALALECAKSDDYLNGYLEALVKNPAGVNPVGDLVVGDCSKDVVAREETTTEVATKENGIKVVCEEENRSLGGEPSGKPNGEYVGVQDDSTNTGSPQSTDDEFGDEWREMALALACAKDDTPQISAMACSSVPQEGDECEHSYILKDDLGYVCRICGVIEKRIEMIFDFQWKKGTNTSRTYASESRSVKEEAHFSFSNTAEEGFNIADISVHPRHMKQMKSHQLEGFNFLRRKLVSDKPSGCVLAHAPGSGKTFMIISFMQSFLAKYPNARPLVVLPKGILGTWKREFLRWQVEEIALYDFYSVKADNRSQQLDVLKEWVENRGILFLGYKQFANIVSDSASSKTSASCHDILLQVPTIMILDEGHTPRNENTDVVHSLSRVQTPRKVVLSGTLFQNHVKEVFNILNLVCPKFLKLETSKAIVRRVLSRVQISGGRKQAKSGVETLFYDSVEEALQNDGDFRRKIMVIQDLREMTKDVLHYYKGDFLEELPGLVDLTVLLNLGPRQKKMIEKLKKLEKFKRSSLCNAVYVHPQLKEFSESLTTSDKGWNANNSKIDRMLNTLDVKEGVKAKFFISLLGLCESSGEKMLVFSQYLLPLKFLERLVTKMKGWSFGKEIFAISGDSTQENREWSMERFNNSPDAKVLFGSIKACGEGISLVGASRLLILDVHLNPSVTRQAIGRAFRPGQLKKVYTYRLVAADSPEEEDHSTCFRKELIAKMWFEWTEYCGDHDFAMEKVEAEELGDMFWESPSLREDVQNLFKR